MTIRCHWSVVKITIRLHNRSVFALSGNVALLKPSFRKIFTRLMDQKYTNDGAAKNVGLLPCPARLFSLTSSHEVVLVGGFYYYFLLRIMLAFMAFFVSSVEPDVVMCYSVYIRCY